VKFANADDALRAAVMRRFAEYDERGPVRCEHCPDRKVVFLDRRSVDGAIAQLISLDGDVARHPYQCPKSTNWHFTSGGPGATRDERTGLQPDHQ
jgi:hypothetical protein